MYLSKCCRILTPPYPKLRAKTPHTERKKEKRKKRGSNCMVCIHARVLAAAVWGEMSSTAYVSTSTLIAAASTAGRRVRLNSRWSTNSIFTSKLATWTSHHHQYHSFLPRVRNDSSGSDRLSNIPASSSERSEGDKLVDGMEFGELCNEFECNSSPLVESTARQLVRDILELREGNRALGTFAVSVTYKDPVRSFTGREKYKRSLWATNSLHNPSVTVQEMVMLSASVLSINWTLRGKPKSLIAAISGDLIIRINSKFTLNQISGQVIEHEELWDLSSSSVIAQAFFWTSRRLFATIEVGKDLTDIVQSLSNRFSTEKENPEIYPDPAGDPTKFFQRDDSFQRDAYQIALFLAVVYFVVQFLRTTL